jgi:hypothetical protein
VFIRGCLGSPVLSLAARRLLRERLRLETGRKYFAPCGAESVLLEAVAVAAHAAVLARSLSPAVRGSTRLSTKVRGVVFREPALGGAKRTAPGAESMTGQI